MIGKTKLQTDRSGVSPVIGVIFMVAVTVIIAATIGATVLGLGDQIGESPPQAQFEVTETIENVEVPRANDSSETDTYGTALVLQHAGGDNVDPTNIEITVDGEPVYSFGTYDGSETSEYGGHAQVTFPFQEATGDIRRLDGTVSAGDETVLVWYGSLGDFDAVDEFTIDPQTDTDSEESIEYVTWPDTEKLFYIDGNQFGKDDDDQYNDFETGDTVRIVWQSGSQGHTLYEYEVR